ncbi:MAG: hypothetical protein NTY66_04440 [Candidatus Vogelbacteria bacterium]|nr:hypothetical protein [Candidatus Vogelbacteria bacterium]
MTEELLQSVPVLLKVLEYFSPPVFRTHRQPHDKEGEASNPQDDKAHHQKKIERCRRNRRVLGKVGDYETTYEQVEQSPDHEDQRASVGAIYRLPHLHGQPRQIADALPQSPSIKQGVRKFIPFPLLKKPIVTHDKDLSVPDGETRESVPACLQLLAEEIAHRFWCPIRLSGLYHDHI